MPCTCLPQVDDPFCEVDGDVVQVPRRTRWIATWRRVRDSRSLLFWAWLTLGVVWLLVMLL